MGNKKRIITAAVLTMLSIGLNVANADNSNSLTQMDIKKSAVTDTVDVTFYTTGDNSNTVVSRKSNNRYVVLLPNVSSSSSIAPSISAVKDLITDINVKHVDDGIGGYTKITFETTKPINIKTYTRKASPLTQAQKDSKAIIAQNTPQPAISTTKPQISAEKPVANTSKPQATNKPTVQNQQNKVATTQPKTTQTATATKKTENKPKLIPVEVPKTTTSQIKPNVQNTTLPKVEAKTQPKPISQPNVQKDTNDFINSSYVPKMKFDESGKRMMDLEPRISHSTTDQPVNDAKANDSSEENKAITNTSSVEKSTITETTNNKHKSFPWWVFIAGGSALTLGALYLVYDAFAHSAEKEASRLESFFSMSAKNQAKRRKQEYYDIVNNDNLNWQEKYKLYTAKEQQNLPQEKFSDISYITDLSAAKQAIIMPEKENNTQDKLAQTINKPEKSHNEIIREKLQAKISQMEHSLSQTPTLKEPEEISNDVHSEDSSILHTFSDIKLKSFSKPLTLKETHRSLIDDDKKLSRNKSYREGRFVKLNNSPLSVNRRNSASSALNTADIIGTGSKYLTNNNYGENKMSKEKENYLLSSLDEYLSILDTEEKPKSTMTLKESLSQVKSSSSDVMSRSGVTNPLRASNKPMPLINGGLVVKSGYNIDSEKGIYLVNIDGVSAIVGRIKGNIYMLKKFDKVIDKPLQVRPENDQVYIVRADKFKCLVDVSQDKMGTLIEI